MTYKLKGVLKSPNGQPLTGVDIQFIAQQTQTPVLQQTDHNIRLSMDGAYDVTLEDNTYAVKAQIGGLGPKHMGYILVSSSTPAGLDLPQLLRSYSQQSTAPDYAQMIEGWLAEAKAAADTSTAQAASAKSQADRAKSEADRASQITGLDTVADAIGLAAVPFPDVWIPFNDSLRMFAGYGREVKVGDDVVARMVNYERNGTATFWDKSGIFRTAAINEPRFEKQGLLIEGQSTNLFLNSETGVTQTISTQAGKYTLSFFGAGTVTISGSATGSLTGVGSEIKATNRVSITVDCSAGNALLTVSGVISKVQFEALPFASSYIPTNGAAVTRAADKCWMPATGNIPPNLDSMTQSVSIGILGTGISSWPRLVELNHSDNKGALIYMDVGTWGGLPVPVSSAGNSAISAVAVARYEDGKLFNNGRSGTTFHRYQSIDAEGIVRIAGYPSVPERRFFGHIKNLRIWHHALSDTQIRGIK